MGGGPPAAGAAQTQKTSTGRKVSAFRPGGPGNPLGAAHAARHPPRRPRMEDGAQELAAVVGLDGRRDTAGAAEVLRGAVEVHEAILGQLLHVRLEAAERAPERGKEPAADVPRLAPAEELDHAWTTIAPARGALNGANMVTLS
jgi:hypothetical protein